MKPDDELLGVKCGSCGNESFQLFERKATFSPHVKITLRVCKTCANKIDVDNAARDDAAAIADMSKSQRRIVFQERSREWARAWHGKYVIVNYDHNKNRGNYNLGEDIITLKVKEQALFACPNDDKGWGRLKVVIDEGELGRIKVKRDTEYNYDYLSFDNYCWTFDWVTHGYDTKYEYPLAFYINWGERERYILEELDQEKERAKAERAEIAARNVHEASKY